MNATHPTAIARLELKVEQDVVHTRQRARLIAEVLGFSPEERAEREADARYWGLLEA